jgi:hypothetical protein
MPEGTEGFVARVLVAIPQLRPYYEAAREECRATGFDDVIVQTFLFDYVRPLLDVLRADPTSAGPPLAEFARVLEAEFGHDAELDSIIDSAFVTLMGTRREPDPAAVLGPKLAAVLDRQRSWRAAPADLALVDRVVTAVPALEPLARDNTFGDHDDVMVHQFLADVVRQEVDNFLAGHLDEVRTVLSLLEREWGSDVDEPIAVSFVENLPYPHEPAAALVDLLGPNLRAEHDRQRHPHATPRSP